MFVLLFGFVFGSAIAVPGGGDYREFLMPGMFAQAMVNGAATTVAVVAAERALGVTDRFRSMPIAPASVLAGRSLADLAGSGLDLAVLVVLGLVVGWSAHGGVLATLAAIGLLLLLRFAMIWVGIFLGLTVSQEAAGLAWAPLFPITMIANTFVAPSQMPGWLGVVGRLEPGLGHGHGDPAPVRQPRRGAGRGELGGRARAAAGRAVAAGDRRGVRAARGAPLPPPRRLAVRTGWWRSSRPGGSRPGRRRRGRGG
jgi:hypothetical protein